MPTSESPKIRVLFLAANPGGPAKLRLDEELREIAARIRASEYRDSLELISWWAVRPGDLQQALLQHKPHIVHFSGHGSQDEEIILEADDGTPKPVSTAALASLFRVLMDNVRIVLLNACYSQAQAQAITQVVDCAIGMKQAVGDQAAIKFAASFYQALGFGRSVQAAFDLGRNALLLERIPEENTPELLVRSGVDPAKIVLVGAPQPGVATPITVTTPEGTSFQTVALQKAVVVVDLSRYSDIAKELEEHSGARAVHELNAQVQGLIKGALKGVVDLAVRPLPYKNTGDGAIIALDTAEQADRFAEALHRAAQAHNLRREVPLAQRHFRVGIWTDPIILDRQTNTEGQFTGFEMAGIAVAKAVRLEGACRTGEILIGPDTWGDLPRERRHLYGDQEEVTGKRRERFRAHRRKVVDPAPWEPIPSPQEMPETADFFVSYADADRGWVEGYLVKALTQAGLRYRSEPTFLDRPRLSEFESAIKGSRRTLLVLSPAYLASGFGQFVDLLAQKYGEKKSDWPVTIVILHKVSLPLDLDPIICLDATNREESVKAIKHLVCPYPGMVSFGENDRERFFGRDQEVEDLVELLRLHPFVTVIGPSGSGKSSLVFAGLVPALRRSSRFGPGQWLERTLRPGKSPLAALVVALGGDLTDLDRAVSGIRADPTRAVSGILQAHAAARLLLVVDQFEELFTAARTDASTEEHREPGSVDNGSNAGRNFQQALLELAKARDCYVVLTVRADFYTELMASPLWREIQEHRFEIVRLNDEGLRCAIVGPAEKMGVSFEATLVQHLVAEAAGEPGIMPFLQEALVLLWERREGQVLLLSGYEALGRDNRTGLQVAMARHANEALGILRPEGQAIARRIFVRLVQFGEGRADTRRQQTVAELRVDPDDGLFDQTLRHLTDSRLLTLSGEEEDSTKRKVDIAHESLISGWPELKKWLSTRRVAEQTRRRLEAKADEWVRLGKGSAGLLDEVELAEADRWLESPDAVDLGIDQDLRALVHESRKAIDKAKQDQEEARRRKLENARALAEAKQRELEQTKRSLASQKEYSRSLRRSLVGMFVAVGVAIVFLTYAWYQRGQAENRRQEAQDNFRQALDAVRQMLMEVGAVELADVPQMEEVREKLLVKAQKFCNDFLAVRANDREVRQAVGRVKAYLGDILRLLGKDEEAEPAYNEGIALLNELVTDGHAVTEDYRDLARGYKNLGLLCKTNNRFPEAEKVFDKAIDIWKKLIPSNPEYEREMEESRYNMATVLARTRKGRKEAEEIYRNALTEQERLANVTRESPEWPKSMQDVARTHNNLGKLLWEAGRPVEAEERFREAVRLLVDVEKDFPSRPGCQWLLARSNNNLANKLMDERFVPVFVMILPLPSGPLLAASALARLQEAELAYRDAEKRLAKLVEDFPRVPDYQQELAGIYYNRGKTSQALTYFEKALELGAKLAKDFPKRPVYQHELAQTHIQLGVLLQTVGRPQPAKDHYRQAWPIMLKLAVAFPDMADYVTDLMRALNNLFYLMLDQGNLVEARRWLDQIKTDQDLDRVRERKEFNERLHEWEKELKMLEEKTGTAVGLIAGPGAEVRG